MEQHLLSLLEKALYHSSFRKAVFSRPLKKEELKMSATLFSKGEETLLQCERFLKDGKAIQKNIPYQNAANYLQKEAENYRQLNLYTQSGEAEIRISDKGKLWFKDRIIATEKAPKIEAHNREKEYIIDKQKGFDFLYSLGISDQKGRILDKKQAKFRQINRFLEFVAEAVEQIPQKSSLTIWDLCCGKSYLTFATYYYLAIQCNRNVKVYAVDRKEDMISKCQKIADQLGYHGLHFLCMDIHDFTGEESPDLVLSLHACDIATDIVLAHAIRHHAKAILSSPCCHHEMNRQMNCNDLKFIEKHPILKQKLCDAATDALRALYLESEGYRVSVVELIDPEETPKNVLIRAYRNEQYNPLTQEAAKQSYEKACNYLQVDPYLKKHLSKPEEK